MAGLKGVLVDTSVWVQFFRFVQAKEGLHLDRLIQAKAVMTCPPIRAEVLSGARTERERSRLRQLFQAIPSLLPPPDLWEEVEEARFHLARKGRQATLVDLMIAYTAGFHEVPLWSLDEDFTAIRGVVWFPRYLPED